MRGNNLGFYRVRTPDSGKWNGHTFIDIQAGESYYPLKDKELCHVLLNLINLDPRDASRRYGVAIGKCGVCGRLLTDPESRSYGIGPVCREKI
ncbi:MAG: DUF6011 domain-containing protein [Candidatus Micrarchaeaceae archaeon]